MTATVKTKYEYRKTEPKYLKKLYQQLKTHSSVADTLGISSGTVCVALQDNVVYMPIEIAAKGIWQTEYEAKGTFGGKEIAVIVGDRTFMQAIASMANATGSTFNVVGKF